MAHRAMFSHSAKRRSGQVLSKTSRRSTKKVVSASGMPRGVTDPLEPLSFGCHSDPWSRRELALSITKGICFSQEELGDKQMLLTPPAGQPFGCGQSPSCRRNIRNFLRTIRYLNLRNSTLD
jgi:hypothetical protein